MADQRSLNRWLLVAAVLMACIQVLAVIVYIYSFIPLVWDDPLLKGVEPKRDPFFYVIFLTLSIVLTGLGVKFVLPGLSVAEGSRKFKLWLALEAFWCFLIFFCFFKWITYRYPFWNIFPYENHAWIAPFFWMVLALSVLSKVFFPEIERFCRRLPTAAAIVALPGWIVVCAQVLFITGLGLLLYVPRPQEVAAMSLAWDQWNHLDQVTAWFVKNGWYLSYEQVIGLLVAATILYIVGLFYFLRLWLKSWFLAAAGALLAVKMGLFYYGIVPCVWIYPAGTFLRHGWDIFLFFGLLFVDRKYPQKFYTAAALAGVILVMGWFACGGSLGALGLDDQPMYAPLRVRQFFPFFMGYFVPVFYVMNLLLLTGLKNARNASAFRLPTVICIYGLMIFVDYLQQPTIGFYGAVIVPAILLMLWWLRQVLAAAALAFQRVIYAALLVLVIGALLTNRMFVIYPGIFQGQDRFSQETALYENFNVIASSAALIQKLTGEDQKAVVLSNFETALLMQAKRPPLFEDFPVMYSGLNNGPGGLDLKTKKQCLDLINSIQDENAPYVFVDQRLLALPPQVLNNTGLGDILNFLHGHYSPYAQQGFLVALQRK